MNCMAKMQAFLLCAALFFALFSPVREAGSAAAEGGTWATAAEAEAARAAAEEKARGLAQEYARLNAEAEAAEEIAEEAAEAAEEAAEALEKARKAAEKAEGKARTEAEQKVSEAEKTLRKAESEAEAAAQAAEEARAAAESVNQQLIAAAMELKEATEASVRMARTETVDPSRISGSFRLGEKYSGRFNEKMEPLYVSFEMTKSARVRMSTVDAKVSITVLDAGGNTILTLVPSSSGAGSVCSLEEGKYTLLISPMGEKEKKISVSVTELPEDGENASEDETFEEEAEETEMMTLVEFD